MPKLTLYYLLLSLICTPVLALAAARPNDGIDQLRVQSTVNNHGLLLDTLLTSVHPGASL